MRAFVLELFCIFALTYGQNSVTQSDSTNLHHGLSEIIGNFSLEFLYHTSMSQQDANLVVSPVTAWTVMAVIAEGAMNNTLEEIHYALRLYGDFNRTRNNFQNILQYLIVNTNTIELARFNGMFVDTKTLPEKDFRDTAKKYYDTEMVALNFSDTTNTAKAINQGISLVTHGRIPTIIDSSDLVESQMLLTSALYFKGQWTSPFNVTSTMKMPFYNSNGDKISEVNMMYNRFTYPFANIKSLKARVIELPYGKEDRLSMLVMLPNPGVSLENLFRNFLKVPLDIVFNELKVSQDEYGEDEVDCFIPRFKIESNLELTNVFKTFGIHDLFDARYSRLTRLARRPMYVSKVIHKAEIEVNEEGTTASGVTAAEFANRIGVIRFEANRPFAYLIIEKLTNTIVFGGIYRTPSLY